MSNSSNSIKPYVRLLFNKNTEKYRLDILVESTNASYVNYEVNPNGNEVNDTINDKLVGAVVKLNFENNLNLGNAISKISIDIDRPEDNQDSAIFVMAHKKYLQKGPEADGLVIIQFDDAIDED